MGGALVHGLHVGAGAHVFPGVFGANVLDREDAIEVHSTVGEFAFAPTCPHKCVRFELCKGSSMTNRTNLCLHSVTPQNPNLSECKMQERWKPYLALGCADEVHCSSGDDTLAFRLLDEHLDRFGWRSW